MDDLQQLRVALYEERIRLKELMDIMGLFGTNIEELEILAPANIYTLKKQFLLLQKVIPQMEGILESIKIINRKIKEYER